MDLCGVSLRPGSLDFDLKKKKKKTKQTSLHLNFSQVTRLRYSITSHIQLHYIFLQRTTDASKLNLLQYIAATCTTGASIFIAAHKC